MKNVLLTFILGCPLKKKNCKGISNLSHQPAFHKWSPERKSHSLWVTRQLVAKQRQQNTESWLWDQWPLISKMLSQFMQDKRSLFLLEWQLSPPQKEKFVYFYFKTFMTDEEIWIQVSKVGHYLANWRRRFVKSISILTLSIDSANLRISHILSKKKIVSRRPWWRSG